MVLNNNVTCPHTLVLQINPFPMSSSLHGSVVYGWSFQFYFGASQTILLRNPLYLVILLDIEMTCVLIIKFWLKLN